MKKSYTHFILYFTALLFYTGCTERQVRVHFENAARQQAHGHIDSAMAEYKAIIKLDPQAADAHNALGALYARQGDFQNALSSHRQAQSIAPDQPDIHFNLGIAYFALGQLDSAQTAYQRVLQKDPTHSDAHNGLGTVFSAQNRMQNAYKSYQSAIQHNPQNADAFNNLGLLHARQGQFKQAAEQYKKAIQQRPQFADAHNNIGSAFAEMGDYEKAKPAFEMALRINPTHAMARANLEQIKEQQKRLEAGEMRARHILVKTEQEAKDILNKLQQGASFEALAQLHSLDPRFGGDLGAFLPGTLMPEFEKAVQKTQPNKIGGPFKTSAGYHIIHRLY